MKYSRPTGAPPWFYWFHKTYDKDRIEADLENIRDLYRDHGYFYALPKEPETKMVDTGRRWPFFFWSWGAGKRVDIKIGIEEGVQYRLGTFHIRGNKLFPEGAWPRVGDEAGRPFLALQGAEGHRKLHQALRQLGLYQFHGVPGYRAGQQEKGH